MLRDRARPGARLWAPAAMTIGPCGHLWVASGEGHCRITAAVATSRFTSSGLQRHRALRLLPLGEGRDRPLPVAGPGRQDEPRHRLRRKSSYMGTLRLRALVRLRRPSVHDQGDVEAHLLTGARSKSRKSPCPFRVDVGTTFAATGASSSSMPSRAVTGWPSAASTSTCRKRRPRIEEAVG
jgi:hypothetical protein